MGNTPVFSECCVDLGRRAPIVQTIRGWEAASPETGPVLKVSDATYNPSALGGTCSCGARLPANAFFCPQCGQPVEEPDEQSGAAHSVSTAASSTPDVGQAQQVIKNFVRTIVKGRTINALTVNGGVSECGLSLDRKLTTLYLQRAGKKDARKRAIPLETIAEICVGDDAGADVELPLTELCVTLCLDDKSALAFQFDDLEDRDTFALCLSMFVDGRRGETQKKAAPVSEEGEEE